MGMKPVKFDLSDPDYTPNKLLVEVANRMGVENYRDIAHRLKLTPSVICHIRKRRHPVTATIVLRLMEVVGMTLDEIRTYSGITTWVPSETDNKS